MTQRLSVIVLVCFLVITPSLSAVSLGIPVWDIGACFMELVNFGVEFPQLQLMLENYKTLSRQQGARVAALKKGFAGLVGDKLKNMTEFSKKLKKTLEETSYYAQYLKGTVFERVKNGEKLLDIVKESFDVEKDLENRFKETNEEHKLYVKEYLKAYEEKITRIEDRMKYINVSKTAGKKRLAGMGARYELFNDVAKGKDSKVGDKVGSESQAISILVESIYDATLQEQDLAIMMRLKFEDQLSRDLNKIYLGNLRLVEQKKTEAKRRGGK